jgi:glucosamine-6-phosphate deaminase
MASSVSIRVFPDPATAADFLADEVRDLIESRRAQGLGTVLGLATGGTPLPFYVELVRRHREQGLSFAGVSTFNLDEYRGLPRSHPESYWAFMHRHLFDHIDLDPARIHLPDSMTPEAEIEAHCRRYEEAITAAGGIDLQILGIGRTGHIGFNEPGSPRDSRTRLVELDELTRRDNSAGFGRLEAVPTHAITMGCGTILAARRLRLMAWGTGKAGIVREAITGPLTDQVSASFLREHPDACFLLDHGAASALQSGQSNATP